MAAILPITAARRRPAVARRFVAAVLLPVLVLLLLGAVRDASAATGREIVFAGPLDRPPYCFRRDGGVPSGYDVDVARALARQAGTRARFYLSDWEGALAAVRDGKANVAVGMSVTRDREQRWDFLPPHATSTYQLFTREDTQFVNGLDDLRGRRLGMPPGAPLDEVLADHPHVQIVASGPGVGLRLLQSREITAYAGDRLTELYYAQKNGLEGIKITGAPLLPEVRYAFAVRKGDTATHGELTRALAAVKQSGELARIQRQWFGRSPEGAASSRLLTTILTGVTLVLLAIVSVGLLWTWTLRRALHRATAALRQSHERLVATEKEKKRFYRDVVLAVTGGKLHLEEADEVPTHEWEAEVPLAAPEGVAHLRRCVLKIARGLPMPDERLDELAVAATEAASNAVKYGRHGRAYVCHEDDRLIVRVQDDGPGISAQQLPYALLVAGYSTGNTLGMGFTLLLELADEVQLATSPNGTIIEIAKYVQAPDAVALVLNHLNPQNSGNPLNSNGRTGDGRLPGDYDAPPVRVAAGGGTAVDTRDDDELE